MEIKNPQKRLNMFWGKVDQKHVDSIAYYVKQGKVLDVGSGMGSTTNYLNLLPNVECIGIDYSNDEVEKARKMFPGNCYMIENSEKLSFKDESFDYIVLRDALHHVYEEANFNLVTKELKRVLKKGGAMIILDPNVNFYIKFLRKISKHEDAECDHKTALKIIDDFGFELKKSRFHTVLSLPLSGGYVGLNFVPNITIIYKALLAFDNMLELLLRIIGLDKYFCWRYLIVAKKPA